MRAKDFRAKAKNVLKRRWDVAVVTTLVAALLGVFGYGSYPGNTSNRDDSMFGINNFVQFFDTEAGQIALTVISLVISVLAIWSLIRFLLGGALKLGYRTFTMNIVDGNDAKFGDLFSKFDMFAKGFVMQLLSDIYTFLWTLLFIIPGIIKAYSYSMAPYILAEHPEMTANESITASKELMRGNKWRLFCLQLSFIGWHILSSLTLGIGYLWLNPYIQVSEAAFYRQICAEKACTTND